MPITEVLALMIPIVALMIPIVAILSHHQRRMAELIHQRNPAINSHSGQIEALRQEVSELKQLVHQQMIAVDNMASGQRKAMGKGEPADAGGTSAASA